ncbi:MAG: serine/threonine-protein kinase [Myxococcota bacterium]
MERCGPYFLVEPLGRGSLAEVFLAVKAAGGPNAAPVALKRPLLELEPETRFISGYMEQATLSLALAHPGVVRVGDLGVQAARDGSGRSLGDVVAVAEDVALGNALVAAPERHYVVMEYVNGVPLNAVMNALLRTTRTIPRPFAFAMVRRVLESLAYAHESVPGGKPSVIHGDVAPANVMITADGAVKVADFGLGRAREMLRLPHHAGLRMKLAYMAPEQARGQPIDPRADLYGVGVMLHEMLACRRMRRGNTEAEILQQVQGGLWPSLESLGVATDAGLNLLLARALQDNPAARFQSANEFAVELDAYLKAQDLVMSQAQVSELITRNFPELAQREAQVRAAVGQVFASMQAPAAAPPPAAPEPEPAPPPSEISGPKLKRPAPDLGASSRARSRQMILAAVGGLALMVGIFFGVRATFMNRPLKDGASSTEEARDLSRLVGGRTVLFWTERVQSLDKAIAQAEAEGGAASPKLQDLKARREDTLRKAKALGITEFSAQEPKKAEE